MRWATMGGSYSRLQSSAQWGKEVDKFAVYGALEGLHDDGFRNFSPSDIRRFYSDVGYRSENAEFHLNVGLASLATAIALSSAPAWTTA